VRVIIEKILPWYPTKVSIQWGLEAVTEHGTFSFNIERSGSPSGGWYEIAHGLTNVYTYDDLLNDEQANTLSLARDIYYRVRAVPPSGINNAFYSPTVNLDGQAVTEQNDPAPGIGYTVNTDAQVEVDPQIRLEQRPHTDQGRKRLLRRKILRDELVLLKKLVGIEFLLLKRRHFGVRCSDCYDPVTRETLNNKCASCYGTSWVGGYYPAIDVLGRRMASQIKENLDQQSMADTDQTRIQLLDFPKIESGDILVEKAHNRRFLVKERYYTTLKTIPVHQTVAVTELERQAVEYGIPVTL